MAWWLMAFFWGVGVARFDQAVGLRLLRVSQPNRRGYRCATKHRIFASCPHACVDAFLYLFTSVIFFSFSLLRRDAAWPRGNSSRRVPVGVSIQSHRRTESRLSKRWRRASGWIGSRARGFMLNHFTSCTNTVRAAIRVGGHIAFEVCVWLQTRQPAIAGPNHPIVLIGLHSLEYRLIRRTSYSINMCHILLWHNPPPFFLSFSEHPGPPFLALADG